MQIYREARSTPFGLIWLRVWAVLRNGSLQLSFDFNDTLLDGPSAVFQTPQTLLDDFAPTANGGVRLLKTPIVFQPRLLIDLGRGRFWRRSLDQVPFPPGKHSAIFAFCSQFDFRCLDGMSA